MLRLFIAAVMMGAWSAAPARAQATTSQVGHLAVVPFCDPQQTNFLASVEKAPSLEMSKKEVEEALRAFPNQQALIATFETAVKNFQLGFEGLQDKTKRPKASDLWPQIMQSLNLENRLISQLALVSARHQNVIDDFTFKILNLAIDGKSKKAPIDLGDYYLKLRALRTKAGLCQPFGSQPVDENSARKMIDAPRWKKHRGITPNERLLITYNYAQIKFLAELMNKTMHRMNAAQAEIRFDTPNEQAEIISLTVTEQYRLALRLFQRDLENLQLSEQFAGLKIQYQDVIAASFELGLVSEQEINTVLGFEELWNPRQTKLDRFLSIVQIGALFVPYGQLVSIAIVGLEAVDEAKAGPRHQQHLF